jgi:transcriptional regulator with XRE-family HTH domain
MAKALAERDMGAVLKIYQQWTGTSQTQLARMIGVGQPTINEVMKGKRKVEALAVFERFASGLGIPPRRLGLADPEDVTAAPAHQAPSLPDTPAERRSVEDTAGFLSALWTADLNQTAERAGHNPGLWPETALDWLLHTGSRARRQPAAGRRVGAPDITAVQATTAMFADLDNRYGGGHARHGLIGFLSGDVGTLLQGRYDATTGRQLFSTVAESMLLAGWMAYDAGAHGIAQRYLMQALHLAEHGEDRRLAGSVLSAMSHQATFLGDFHQAACLARTAVVGTKDIATATMTAQFHAMEARAHAGRGDAAACDASLSAAERAFSRRNPDDDPAWIRYFDEAELSAEFGHCFRDLGRAAGARAWAGRSVEASSDGTFARSDFFAAMVLADAHLDHGDPEPACTVALQALAIGDQLKSARCAVYVTEFRGRLARVGRASVARRFTDQAASHRLWQPATG